MKKFLFLLLAVISVSLLIIAASCSEQFLNEEKETAETQEKEIQAFGIEEEKEPYEQEKETTAEIEQPTGEYRLLYHLTSHSLSSHMMKDEECFYLNFYEFLDRGIIKPDGKDNHILDLKEYPTSLITSK
jgi:hypothetical protein